MNERLLIKHGVGSRTFFDTNQTNAAYEIEKTSLGWRVSIFTERTEAVNQILAMKHELNLFVFEEENGIALRKTWYYLGQGSVDYDDDRGCLTLVATNQITYVPTDYFP